MFANAIETVTYQKYNIMQGINFVRWRQVAEVKLKSTRKCLARCSNQWRHAHRAQCEHNIGASPVCVIAEEVNRPDGGVDDIWLNY